MFSKASLVLLGLIVGAASSPVNVAAANSLGTAGGINGKADRSVQTVAATDAAAQQQRKAAMLKKKKAQQQQAAAARAKALQQQEPKKKDRYESDRDRGLDIAAEYAPDTIARVRKNNHLAKGDTVNTGNGKKGWQQYVDRYYKR